MEKTKNNLPHNKGEKKRVFSTKSADVNQWQFVRSPKHIDEVRNYVLPWIAWELKFIKISLCLQ